MWRRLLLTALALMVAPLVGGGRGQAQSPQVSVATVAAAPAGAAAVPVVVTPDPQAPLGALLLRIAYDPSRLRAASFASLAAGVLAECNLAREGEARCGVVHATGMAGQVVVLTFRVLSTSPAGLVPLSLTVEECFTVQAQSTTCLAANGGVLVQVPTAAPPPPTLVALQPLDDQRALISWQPPTAVVTHYRLRSALNFEMTFALNQVEATVETLGGLNLLVVGVPQADGLTFYYQLAACNPAGCSPFVRAGGLARRIWPGANDWNFYLAAYDFLGTTTAAAVNASPLLSKASVMAFYDGVQGFGGVQQGVCEQPVPPGRSCLLTWTGASPFVSASQAFPPFGEVGAALRLR